MKKNIKYAAIIFIVLVIGIIVIRNKLELDFSINNLRVWVEGSYWAPMIFVGLWVLRLIAFIPGMTLMVLGGVIFSPMEAIILSLMGLIVSDSLIFLIGKSDLFKDYRNKLENKYSDMLVLIQKYNYKFLAVGVLCPVAPTDVICYLSSYLGIGYFKYIITFIIANGPAVFLYSYIGESFEGSIYNTIFIILTLAITGLLSLNIWNKFKGDTVNTQIN